MERADGTEVCPRCALALTPWTRLRGLLGRAELPVGEGLLLRPAGSIHMLFMRFAIDAVFLTRAGEVLEVRAGLRPWRLAAVRGAKQVLELPAGEAAARGIAAGDVLVWDEGG